MDKLAALQVFVRIVESGSLTKAATSLGWPKTRVTRLLQDLESELETKLVHRTTRKLVVTADGWQAYERAGKILAELASFEAATKSRRAAPRGRLRIDVPGFLGRYLIVPAIDDFTSRHPGIQLELGVGDRIVDVVGDHLDAVIRTGRAVDDSLVAKKIGAHLYVACATPGYLARAGIPAEPAALARAPHTTVHYFSAATGRLVPFRFTRGEERVEVVGRCVLAVDDSSAYFEAGLTGIGAVVVPAFLARARLRTGDLVPILDGWTPAPRDIFFVYPRRRQPNAALGAFRSWVTQLLTREPLLQRP